MRDYLLLLISIALTETIVQCFSEGEALRKAVRFAGGTALAIAVLGGAVRFDYAAYAASLRREMLAQQPETTQIQAETRRLSRLLIEEECAAYIRDRAQSLGVVLTDVKVTLAWNTSGFWYPVQTELTTPSGSGRSSALSAWIQSELGVAEDAQYWREDGQEDELEDTGRQAAFDSDSVGSFGVGFGLAFTDRKRRDSGNQTG